MVKVMPQLKEMKIVVFDPKYVYDGTIRDFDMRHLISFVQENEIDGWRFVQLSGEYQTIFRRDTNVVLR